MSDMKRVRVLCVDDDPNILEGLALHLRRRYDVVTAPGGDAALQVLQKPEAPVAVIISDMRMPGMNGATLLARARQSHPDTVRMLLTGQADMDSAVSAVNDGQIFRFLTKPCPPPMLMAAVEAAAKQHALITTERVLLEQTLRGSIKALTDILALTSPASFGRATQIRRLVTDLSEELHHSEVWQVEVAAMLSQIGSIILPPEVVDKVHYGQPLSVAEREMVARGPAVTEQLLGNIPRLEVVRGILANLEKPAPPDREVTESDRQLVARGAQVLRVAIDFDALESQGNSSAAALDTMRGRTGRYEPEVLTALSTIRGGDGAGEEVRELPLSALRVGMVFLKEIRTAGGMLLCARGHEVTLSILERLRNFPPGTVRELVRVVLPKPIKKAG